LKEIAEKTGNKELTAGTQGVKMQHKLLLYLISMLLAVFSALLVVLSIAGVFSRTGIELRQEMASYHQSTVAEVEEQINILTAQGIAMSEQASDILERNIYAEPVSVLNDDAQRLLQLEKELYPIMNTVLRTSPCNGVWMILDATINTRTENADTSRAGLYLRFANLNAKNAVHQDVTLYRGIADIARENQMELHNRWRMEYDISRITGYEEMMAGISGKLVEKAVWTERERLTDTWEQVMYLMLPVYGRNSMPLGCCGIELSGLYMGLSYPVWESQYGDMVTVLAPMEEGKVYITDAITGELGSTHLKNTEILTVDEGRLFYSYQGNNERYLGIHTKLDMKLIGGRDMYLITLIPENHYETAALRERYGWILGSLLFLVCMMAGAVVLSGRFVNPISKSLSVIQENGELEDSFSGISEIDTLISFMMVNNRHGEDSLPPDIAELFDDFVEKAGELTGAEKNILAYYAEGKDVMEVAELAFISIHTVRKHNMNIYRKLGVSSREELVLYLDLFRRCGRLDEIL